MITRSDIVSLVNVVGACIAAKNADLIAKERRGEECDYDRHYLMDLMYKNDALLRSYLVGDTLYGAVTQQEGEQCLGSDWNIEKLYSYLKNECDPACRSLGDGTIIVNTPVNVIRGTNANEYIDANGDPILIP